MKSFLENTILRRIEMQIIDLLHIETYNRSCDTTRSAKMNKHNETKGAT